MKHSRDLIGHIACVTCICIHRLIIKHTCIIVGTNTVGILSIFGAIHGAIKSVLLVKASKQKLLHIFLVRSD